MRVYGEVVRFWTTVAGCMLAAKLLGYVALTRRANMADRKLEDSQQAAIREAFKNGDTVEALADAYGVSKAAITKIVGEKA